MRAISLKTAVSSFRLIEVLVLIIALRRELVAIIVGKQVKVK